ncbi:hypothetical protein 2 [Beihai sobemo-like virus 20]|uniref:hypothetical protein 2 n=1 Tax=Beihai sobemo-like virus 20 TaxID=1922692 RepID=UPI00090C855A|nr:hypothetical protein 2 [Beihai sobemo-like virus 20]APG75668.1 hypothetical protein 2 [Beihai sobemo-like virus 20]
MDMVVDPTTSPGLPWTSIGTTNAQVFGYQEGIGFRGQQVEILYKEVILRLQQLREGPKMNDINLFIKPEPHKPKKVEQGAWRLIHGVSITDQMVAEIVMGELMDLVYKCPGRYGPMIGWSPFTTEGIPYFNFFVGNGPKQSADKSSWDWTVQDWLAEVFIDLICYIQDDLNETCSTQLRNHMRAILGRKVIVGKGQRFTMDGGLPSGWKATIFANSVMQEIIHHVAEKRSGCYGKPPITMGDDTLQEPMPPAYWEALATTGCILKEVVTHQDRPYEFCGFHFGSREYEPSYKQKHAFLVRHIERENFEATIQSYQILYLFDERRLNALRRWCELEGFAHCKIDVSDRKYVVRGTPE